MNPATIELTAPDISCGKGGVNIGADLAGEPAIKQVTVDVGTPARPHRLPRAPDQPRATAGQARRDRIPGLAGPDRPVRSSATRIGRVMNAKAPPGLITPKTARAIPRPSGLARTRLHTPARYGTGARDGPAPGRPGCQRPARPTAMGAPAVAI
jgi:hypothetical protein